MYQDPRWHKPYLQRFSAARVRFGEIATFGADLAFGGTIVSSVFSSVGRLFRFPLTGTKRRPRGMHRRLKPSGMNHLPWRLWCARNYNVAKRLCEPRNPVVR